MINALRYEWVRLTTLRSTWVLSALAIVLITGLVALIGTVTEEDGNLLFAKALTLGLHLTAILVALLGVFAFGHEYRHGTIRVTLAALPRRQEVMAAKVLLVSVWAAAVTVVALVLASVAAFLTFSDRAPGLSLAGGPMPRVLLGAVVFMVLWSLVGLAYAGLFRNVAAALVVLLIVPLVVENLVMGLLSLPALESLRGLARFLPFSAAQAITAVSPHEVFDQRILPWQGALTLGVFTLALLLFTWLLFQKRDA